jgi:HK97 family phage major capsid protein
MKAMAELERIYGRAVMTEGIAGASGAVSTGTGGELIPRPLEMVVMIERDRVAKMRRWAQQITMTAQTHTVPTAAAMTANMVGESTTSADGNPDIAQVQLTAKKGQVTALATNEMLADAAINVINLWATRGGAAIGVTISRRS